MSVKVTNIFGAPVNGYVSGQVNEVFTCPTPTPTPTRTSTPTPTPTPSSTPTPTPTPTPTISPTPTPTPTPTTSVPNLVYNLDAANYSSIPTNNSTDLGTSSYTVTTNTPNSRITWNSANGGVFRSNFGGDGIGDYIIGGPNFSSTQSYTVFMAYKLNTASAAGGSTANYGRLLNSNTGSPDWLMGGYSAYPKVFYTNGVTINLTGAARDTVWHLDFVVVSGTGASKRADLYSATSSQPTTTTFTSTNSGISGFNSLRLFAKSDGNECAPGDIGFVKVWDGALSLSDIQSQYALYKTRFGY